MRRLLPYTAAVPGLVYGICPATPYAVLDEYPKTAAVVVLLLVVVACIVEYAPELNVFEALIDAPDADCVTMRPALSAVAASILTAPAFAVITRPAPDPP